MSGDPPPPPSLGPLGKATVYVEGHDPSLLFVVDREPQRRTLPLAAQGALAGHDRWTAWEASWLDSTGKPQVAVVRFVVPATSPRIVESKSVKLYLTALNTTVFADSAAYAATLTDDLSKAAGAAVDVELIVPEHYARLARRELPGMCIDAVRLGDGAATRAAARVDARADVDASQLVCGGPPVDEMLYTRLFRSLCPVTTQPDYASVHIRYRGPRVDHSGLLAYLLSYRHHAGFHEHCAERIAADLLHRCRPDVLEVTACFTRRGGIDINPWRHHGLVERPSTLAPTPVQ
jgi:7-cyano-7-deazaguanine reductase